MSYPKREREGRGMCGLRVVLGWEQLLEAEDSALPALQVLCRALEVDTFWNPEERTLYLESPVCNRVIAVGTELTGLESVDAEAQQIVSLLHRRLACAGATVTPAARPSDLPDSCELLLRVTVAPNGPFGISAAHSWMGWRSNRKLAEYMVESAARHSGLPALGCRVSLNSSRQAKVSVITITVGRPATPTAAFVESVAEGLFQGLSQCWADPVLFEIYRTLSHSQEEPAETLQSSQAVLIPTVADEELPPDPEPDLTTSAEPESVLETETECQLEPEPNVTFCPEPEPAPEPEPVPEPVPEPDPEPELEPEPEPVPQLAVHMGQPVQVIEPETVLVLSPVTVRSTDHTPPPPRPPRCHRPAPNPEPTPQPTPPTAGKEQAPPPQSGPAQRRPARTAVTHVFNIQATVQSRTKRRK